MNVGPEDRQDFHHSEKDFKMRRNDQILAEIEENHWHVILNFHLERLKQKSDEYGFSNQFAYVWKTQQKNKGKKNKKPQMSYRRSTTVENFDQRVAAITKKLP